MTTQEIKLNNELIAKFMGWEYEIHSHTYRLGDSIRLNINFNSNWELIMPVCEKINTLNPNGDGSEQFEVTISHNACEIVRLWCGNIQGRWKTGLYNKLNTLESTWFVVVEFIKWYNKSK